MFSLIVQPFHTCVYLSQCENYGNSLSRIFGKNFVKVTVLPMKLLNKWFDEIFFGKSKFPWFQHCVLHSTHCGKTRNSLSQNIFFRQINSLVTYLVKPLLSRNFFQKWVRENSRNFHTVVWKLINFTVTVFTQK